MSRHRNDGEATRKGGSSDPSVEEESFKIDDRRHSSGGAGEESSAHESEPSVPRPPSVLDEARRRAEAAESKLQEYIAAYRKNREEQDQVRQRLEQDVERRVELKFGDVVAELLETLDDLDLALAHVASVPGAEPLARGVTLARDRFLSTLERHGIERIVPDDATFDPNEAEALRMAEVDSPDQDGLVVETLRPGYRLGQRVIRPARVSVGRYTPNR